MILRADATGVVNAPVLVRATRTRIIDRSDKKVKVEGIGFCQPKIRIL